MTDAGPLGGRSDTPTHPQTDPRLMELPLGGAAPSGQARRQADGWATRPATRTLTAVLQGQQGRLWGPSFSHSTNTGLAGGPPCAGTQSRQDGLGNQLSLFRVMGVVMGRLWELERASDPRDQVDGYDDGRGSSWWDGSEVRKARGGHTAVIDSG